MGNSISWAISGKIVLADFPQHLVTLAAHDICRWLASESKQTLLRITSKNESFHFFEFLSGGTTSSHYKQIKI
jgi:hypothetical protein